MESRRVLQRLDLLEDPDSLFPDSLSDKSHDNQDLSSAFSASSVADSEEWVEPSGFSEYPVKTSRIQETTSSTTINTTTTKKKSTFQRQRDELLSLQSQIEELEAQLQNLRGERRLQVPPMDIAYFDQSVQQAALSLSLWRMVAKRQWSERRAAEEENAELRKMLKEQTQLAKSLQRMIKTRPMVMKMLQQKNQRQVADVSERDSEIFQELFDKIEERVGSVDAYFVAHGLTPSTTSVNLAHAVPNGRDVSHVEFTRATMLPFHFHSLSDVVWNHLRQHEMKMDGTELHTNVVTDTDELLVTKQVLRPTSCTGSGSGSTVVFSVSRRVVQEHRVLFFWEWLVEMNGSTARRIPAAYLNQRGCGQIVRAGDRALNGLPALLLQYHGQLIPIQMEPSVNSPDLDHQHHQQQQYLDSAALTDMLLALNRQNTQTFLGSVEKALVEEMLA